MTTTEKTCFKCNVTKPLTEFYTHSQMADGHLNKCKSCNKVDTRRNRFAHRDYYNEYDRERALTEKRKENAKKQQVKWREAFPERKRAACTVRRAVLKGIINKTHCFICGDENVQAHHPDYSRPLDVIWLCVHHHKMAHAMIIEYKEAA